MAMITNPTTTEVVVVVQVVVQVVVVGQVIRTMRQPDTAKTTITDVEIHLRLGGRMEPTSRATGTRPQLPRPSLGTCLMAGDTGTIEMRE